MCLFLLNFLYHMQYLELCGTLMLWLFLNGLAGSYGSTLRYKSVERLKPVGKHSLLGASGEISDFQEILRYLDELM